MKAGHGAKIDGNRSRPVLGRRDRRPCRRSVSFVFESSTLLFN